MNIYIFRRKDQPIEVDLSLPEDVDCLRVIEVNTLLDVRYLRQFNYDCYGAKKDNLTGRVNSLLDRLFTDLRNSTLHVNGVNGKAIAGVGS